METKSLNPKVDAYLAKAAPFAQPILTHLRAMIHKASPAVSEEIKWSHPFFLHNGVILANMAAFKAYCSLGFWGGEMTSVLAADGILQDGGMGSLGRITALADLPSDKQLLGYLRRGVALIDAGQGGSRFTMARRVVKAPKSEPEAPPEFTAALEHNKAAAARFSGLSASCKREYIEWIASAKQAATRERRIAQAIPWIAEGKQRNWKYQDC